MQEIFDKIKDRQWDWFEWKDGRGEFFFSVVYGGKERKEMLKVIKGVWESLFSLADLLANPSWCKAVWGDEYIGNSRNCFNILQQEGHNAAIKYIKSTME